MMYGGLRGGVAFALVLLISEEIAPHAKMFVTTTLAMVYWTVFVQVKHKPRPTISIKMVSTGHNYKAHGALFQSEEEDGLRALPHGEDHQQADGQHQDRAGEHIGGQQ